MAQKWLVKTRHSLFSQHKWSWVEDTKTEKLWKFCAAWCLKSKSTAFTETVDLGNWKAEEGWLMMPLMHFSHYWEIYFALWPCVWDYCSIKYQLLNVLWKFVLCCYNEKKILRNTPNPLISAPWQSWLSFHSSRAAHPGAVVLVVSVSVMHETLALGSLAGEGSALRVDMCLWWVYTGKHCVVW